jgi:hypothetical protein
VIVCFEGSRASARAERSQGMKRREGADTGVGVVPQLNGTHR